MERLVTVDAIQPQELGLYRVVYVSMTNPVSGQADDPDDGYIPGAVKFDLDGEGSDHSTTLPHTLPSVVTLSKLLGRLGISADSRVLLYDNMGMFSAPRVWWMLKSLGHNQVQVLNGGLPAWKTAGKPVSQTLSTPAPTEYVPQPENSWFCNAETVESGLETQDVSVLDARSQSRFNGEAPEPRAGLRSGHMPGALNIPFTDLLIDGIQLKSRAELTTYFSQRNVDLTQSFICSCGSGVTACIVGMAVLEAGAQHVLVYDGSWSEWGADPKYTVVTS